MKHKILLIIIFILFNICASLGGYLYWLEKSLAVGKIISGVKIDGIDVGDLSPGQVFNQMQNKEGDLLSGKIELKYGEKYWTMPFNSLAKSNLQEVIKNAGKLGRGKGIIGNFSDIRLAKKGDFNYQLKIIPDEKKINDYVYGIKASINTEPVEPKINTSNKNEVSISPPKEGINLNIKATINDILLAVRSGRTQSLNASVEDVKPRFTKENVKKWQFNGYITSFTTNFNPNKRERTENVRIAAKAIDKAVIYPGEVFSFNDVVGPRSEETGYKEAIVIQNNLFTPGIGGGVCQVSTTLYNNVLKADLKVVERRRHSLPVPYISPGLDATVAYKFVDLKFRNNYDYPIIIRAYLISNSLFIGILGNTKTAPKVNITTRVDRVLEPSGTRTINDPNLPIGVKVIDKPQKGYKVTVLKNVLDKSGYVKSIVSRDTYPPTPQVIHIGTKKAVSGGAYGKNP